MSVRIRLIALLAALVVVGAACGDDSALTTKAGGLDSYADERTSATTVASATTLAPATPDASGEGDLAGGPNSAPIETTLSPADLGRSIVYTATIEVEVDDVIAAGAAAQQAVAPLGGLLFGQDTTTGPNPRSVLTFKVRPEDFQEALARLAGIGTLVGQSVNASDVTERVVDLQSRISTAEASVERLRTFLSQATDLKDVASLESELMQRETDLEVLRGQLRTVETAVSLATITLVLSEPTPEPALELAGTAYFGHDAGQGCPGSRDLAVDEGDPVTYCYQLTNTGDTALADIEIRDSGLDARTEDFIVVDGDLDAVLLPGERILLALEVAADPAAGTNPSVSATAVADDGTPLHEAVATTGDLASVSVAKDTSLPGFTDALRASWHGVEQVVGVTVLVAGSVVPFLWLPLLLGLIAVWLRRKRKATTPNTPTEG